MEFLCSFLRRHLVGKPVVVSPNVGFFLRLKPKQNFRKSKKTHVNTVIRFYIFNATIPYIGYKKITCLSLQVQTRLSYLSWWRFTPNLIYITSTLIKLIYLCLYFIKDIWMSNNRIWFSFNHLQLHLSFALYIYLTYPHFLSQPLSLYTWCICIPPCKERM